MREKLIKKVKEVENNENKILSLSSDSDVIFKAVFQRNELVLIKMIKDFFLL